MRVLPGDLVSATAGAILRRGMMVHGVVTAPDGCDVVFDDMLVHEATPHGTTVVSGYGISLADPARLSVDPNDELTRDACARWLARHHGLTVGATAPRWYRSEPYWILCAGPQVEDGEEWDGELDFGPSPSGGGPDRRLREDVTDPAEALALACLAAGGRS